MAIIKTEAIVLKQFDLGEADKIITFYSKDYGKIRAVARGVRKSRNSVSGLVLPFSYNQHDFYKGKSLYRINDVKHIFSFSKLREDISKMAYASFMAEMVEKVGLEGDSNPALFSLLLSSFHQLIKNNKHDLKYIELAFKIRILAILGIKPELKYCISCNRKLNKNNCIINSRLMFDIKNGGLYCHCCLQNTAQKDFIYELSVESLKNMKKLFISGLRPVEQLNISNRSLQELDQIINKYIDYHLELSLKSFDFLNMIKSMG